jgi:glycosyltransferase involved in cell wall biosynthesis
VTEAIRRQYVAGGLVPPERVVALPGGVDVERFHPGLDGAPFRRALGVAPDTPLIGLVAGLRVMKGHRVAVEAVRRLAGSGQRFHVLFVGTGPFEPSVRQAIVDAGLESRITVTGFAPDLPGAIAALDVALYAPLESDGMSRVLFEYLAVGKPVVASRVGVVPEVLEDGRTALLVPAGEAGALAESLGRLLGDPSLRARLGAAASELGRRLSGAEVARRLGALYAGLVPGGRRRTA